ncbi:MAG: hypothetical protein HC836_45465 [Richelia sp. RM2_1_2]|nr:hypothetical protein [Richelia sp. RM2_1_2]
MAYFKVKSVTNRLAKRDIFYNAVLEIEINAKFDHETHKLGAGRELVINAENLPLSVHKLRAKKLVEVIKISEDAYLKQAANKMNASKEPTKVATPVLVSSPFLKQMKKMMTMKQRNIKEEPKRVKKLTLFLF